MKKSLLCMICAVGVATAANAQAILGYSVSETSGTYAALTDATVVFDGAATEADNNSFAKYVVTPTGLTDEEGPAAGYSLGFTLNFAGETYTDFVVSTGGYLFFGNGEVAFNPNMGANFLTWGDGFTIAGFGCNKGVQFDENTKISYKSENETLVVQYENYRLQNTFFDDGTPVNIQLTVKADGTVSYVFDSFSNLADADSTQDFSLYLGLRADDANVCLTGSQGSLSVVRNDSNQASFGLNTPNGWTVTWNIPQNCSMPTVQPTALELTSTSDEIEGEFTAAAGVDSYLVVYAATGLTLAAPVNGTTYAKGDEYGEGKVAYFGPDTEFRITNLPGSTAYDVYVYSVNCYGLNGPVYYTESPLSASATTLPAPAKEVAIKASTPDSITLTVEGNDDGDDVVVLYNTYCARSNYGDHGLFGEIPADAAVGTVIAAPEDYEPYFEMENAPMPANAGVVAYVGATGDITILGLEASTPYYLAVYTRNEGGFYTSEPVYTGASTTIECPYSGDSYNFPRFQLPLGWTGSEQSQSTYSFRDEDFWNASTQSARQGTQPIQQRMAVSQGDAVNGKSGWMILPPVNVNERHTVVKAEYCATQSISRFAYQAYNEWAEEDVLQWLVSEDGENWTVLTEYNAQNHPEQEELYSYVSISADLNDYRGKTVYLKYYWNTYGTGFFGLNMYVDRISVEQAEYPDVPEVTVSEIKSDSAVVSWVSTQTDYELSYAKVGDVENAETVSVKNALTYTLTGLDALTEYVVKVRGLLPTEEGEETAYSEWSDEVTFTTADYPVVDAPVNLVADVETYKADGKVKLSWDAIAEAESYEVAYRLASSTEWTYVDSDEASVVVAEIEPGKDYVWKVRANCTHDRVTAYSAQARFMLSSDVAVAEVSADCKVAAGNGVITVTGASEANVVIYDAAGKVCSARNGVDSETFAVASGLYLVKVGCNVYKVVVR